MPRKKAKSISFKLKSLTKEALEFYKTAIRNNIKRIPLFIYGLFALFGAVWLGIMIGFSAGEMPDPGPSELDQLREDNVRLRDLVDEYEKLGTLYYEQGTNVAVFTNLDTLQNDPFKVATALRSMEEYRDLINVQTGRILELRKSAGYSEASEPR